jgi:Uma2 family endonuclease
MKPAYKTEKVYNYKDYLNWNDDKRWEIIEGIVYDMSPAPSRSHQEISGEIFRQISNHLLNNTCKIYSAPFDVRLVKGSVKDSEITNVVQPDLVIVCDQNKLDIKGCIGSPDIVIEIVSPYTAPKDVKEKFILYEKYKIKEYWIVYPFEKNFFIFKLGTDGKYGRPDIYCKGDKIQIDILKGLELDLDLVFKE